MNTSKRRFIATIAAAACMPGQFSTTLDAAQSTPWHEDIARKAKALSTGKPLRLLIPKGCGANIRAVTQAFTRLTQVPCIIEQVEADEINIALILRESSGDNAIDLALPATYGLIDLVTAKAILALDDYADKYEPPGFATGHLYRKGDSYRGKFYGYQTDGDAYLLFYNKQMMENPEQIKAYKALTGKPLEPASSWEDLDSMMAFFHRPEQNQYGGCLYRNAAYLVWEWWARFHAKGALPFTHNMKANINNAKGVAALEELIAASEFLSPGSRTNGFVDNWNEFAGGNIFCNMGWGGTQKFLSDNDTMRNNLIHSALPGHLHEGKKTTIGYMNWGWNYTVGAQSTQAELAYLMALFASSPIISTLSVRESEGFFDPFHEAHYTDSEIIKVYGSEFLAVHRQSMENAIPDLYLSGQSNYLDALRLQILTAMTGELSAAESLDVCAQKWSHITRRLGKRNQAEQWRRLAATYPQSMLHLLEDDDAQ